MKIFAFLLTDSTRVDVEASTPRAAYFKLRSIPFFKRKLTTTYQEYHSGIAPIDAWRGLEEPEDTKRRRDKERGKQ